MTSSFNRRLQAAMDQPGWHDDPVWRWNAKLDGRDLADSVGVRTPELLQVADRVDDLHAPVEAVAVKPNHGCAGRGVWVLRPEGDVFESLMDGIRVSWHEVQADCAAQESRSHPNPHEQVLGPWLVERAIHRHRVPIDWKAYCIGGEPMLWRQMARSRDQHGRKVKRVKHWTSKWRTANAVVEPHGVIDDTLPPPRDGDALTAAARAIAALVPGPFIRVDLYEDELGPLFGEITPQPGDNRIVLRSKWDHRLGKAWRRALEAG